MIGNDVTNVNAPADKLGEGGCHDILGSELVGESTFRNPYHVMGFFARRKAWQLNYSAQILLGIGNGACEKK